MDTKKTGNPFLKKKEKQKMKVFIDNADATNRRFEHICRMCLGDKAYMQMQGCIYAKQKCDRHGVWHCFCQKHGYVD
jgi:hypothetical protein